ncbi:MAG: MerR family transcriptional regulator [Deltaproteobacteria bacterium]|nr:MerR family transcriptional regulator [Deltaproteobacteria bacterium]
MKMKDLIKKTGVSREMIHYFVREGMLPPVEKPLPNQARYEERHVERILLIKKLQQKHFLPISQIKKIIRDKRLEVEDEELLEIKSAYFETNDYLMPEEIKGENTFLEYTGMSPERLKDFENYRIIVPRKVGGEKVYPHDAVQLGKLIGDMRKRGLSHENGFSRTALKKLRDNHIEVLYASLQRFRQDLIDNDFSKKEIKNIAKTNAELIPIFVYHLTHNFMQEILKDTIKKGSLPSAGKNIQ